MRVLILLLISTACFAQIKNGDLVQAGDQIYTNQGGQQLINVKKSWPVTKIIPVQNGQTYKWTSNSSNPDTARYFDTGIDEYEFTLTARKKLPPIQNIRIEAEHAEKIEGASLDPSTQGNTVCCITATATKPSKLIFTTFDIGVRKKIVFNYARGHSGQGKITVTFTRTGGQVSTYNFYLESTGNNVWNIWKEAQFDIPAGLSGQLTLSTDQYAAWNLDWVEFR